MNERDFTPEGHRGKVAYEAYSGSTGGKTFDGRQMPAWADLGDRIQLAWITAARAVADALRTSEGKSA